MNYIYLNFDMSSLGNILFTEQNASFIDLAFFKSENLDLFFSDKPFKSDFNNYLNIFEDSVHLPSNIRLFECCFIWRYFVDLYYKF